MTHAYQIHKQEADYFLTMTTVEWVDIYIRDKYKNLLCESLNYCVENKGLEIFCYVLMSTHLHLIVRAKNGNLSDIIRDFKKFTSGKLINEIKFSNTDSKDRMLNIFNTGGQKQKKKSNYQVWQYNNPACIAFGQAGMRRKFIARNLLYQK
jgi:REP element-mobilizing transposase RayT